MIHYQASLNSGNDSPYHLNNENNFENLRIRTINFLQCKRKMLIALSKTSSQPSHSIEYELKISAQDPRSTDVVSVVYQFCTVFGRDKIIGGKRARTKNVKYFSTFWTDGYKLLLSTAHTKKWGGSIKTLRMQKTKKYFCKCTGCLWKHLACKSGIFKPP